MISTDSQTTMVTSIIDFLKSHILESFLTGKLESFQMTTKLDNPSYPINLSCEYEKRPDRNLLVIFQSIHIQGREICQGLIIHSKQYKDIAKQDSFTIEIDDFYGAKRLNLTVNNSDVSISLYEYLLMFSTNSIPVYDLKGFGTESFDFTQFDIHPFLFNKGLYSNQPIASVMDAFFA